jgi:hypothetical protein
LGRRFCLLTKSFLVFFGAAWQEPDVPAPRMSDENPFFDRNSGVTGIWFY